ncbi:sensor histidine kinase [Metabacillus halosaccharovorans]|uniref:sensor histidine kinase n=1 Tax=Metabacillus halosaccharovorans TaxID=930124 RepID=UPI001C200F52|nr:sensor histidine kinase [Metabacillus halosaccharovorans]MBU7594210.1 HAMP domain-containing histidine kinase [Metabacillus halosaccharovorans]
MIKEFLIERISWILFIFATQLLILFVAYLDPVLTLKPIIYIVFIITLLFIIFLIFRYNKETKFYKLLKERENNFDSTDLPNPETPFEEIITTSSTEQTERLKQLASQNKIILEQEKDELLSWIHEVKTPLTAMHLIFDRIEDQKLKSDVTYEWLRIHLLLDQQLHQKRISFIENDLHIEKTDLEQLLFDEIKTLQTWCIQKRIGFDLKLNTTEVLTDAKWLAFIIRQLLTNAVKYSEDSDITVKSLTKNNQVILQISDSGRGIDPKDISRIFDKGFTSTTNHSDQSSTGMGLYLAKKVAHTLHIHIEVESTLYVGTTFILIFSKRNEFIDVMGM